MAKVFYTTIFILLFLGSYCQDTIPIRNWIVNKADNPTIVKAGVQYFFQKYDMEQGLDDPYILRIRQNKNGEILYGTSGNGAGIFDGINFRFFNCTNGLKSNVVQDICEDNFGNLWFATIGGGLSKFDGSTFRNYDSIDGIDDNAIWSILNDSKGNIWFGTEKGSLYSFDGKVFTNWSKTKDLKIRYIREIFEDSKGNIWFGSNHMGFAVYDGNNFKIYNKDNGLPNNHVLGICEDKKGNIWLTTYGGGLCKFSNGTFTTYGKESGLESLILCDVICDKGGDLWVASSGNGMFRFDGKKFTPFSVSEGLSHNVVLSLLEDRYGNIWAGTFGGGINKYTAKQFSYFSQAEGLSGNVVRAILQRNDSSYVFTTSGAGFSIYNGKEFRNYTNGQQIPSLFVLCAIKDKNGDIWLGTSGGGICRFDGTHFYTLTTSQGLTSNYFISMFYGADGEIYAGSYGTGLNIIRENNIVHYGKNEGLPSININAICQDLNKNVWIGTETGLYLLSNGKISQQYSEYFNKTYPVSTIICDPKGNILIGTDGNGLFILDNEHFEFINNTNGLCNNHVKSLAVDSRKGIWVGTSNGIAYLNPRKGNAQQKYLITNYGRPEGYTGSACMNNSIYIDHTNKIWIGTGRKLLCIDPEKEKLNFLPPVVKIEKLDLFFENIDWKHYSDSGIVTFEKIESWTNLPLHLVLPYNQNHLTFSFKGINLNCPEKTTFKYMLMGMDQTWNPITNENKAVYSNISPGKYTFKVIAINENGITSENEASYSFEILPPWWEQTWFRVFAIIVFITSVIVIIKWREKKLVRDKQKLEKIVEERTAEVVKQRDEIQSKNVVLSQQKEEILSQRDEIETQMEEIATQRDLVLEQKQQIEIIHTELTDSIHYAKRIQNAILPKMDVFHESGFDYFTVFLPRNIVSGDFYWAAKINSHLVFCVADCTGHGVPGAFMSMLGISFLNEIVKKEKNVNASQILNELREHIVNSLQQKGLSGESKDGMDISLCTLDIENLKLQFAGANNPLYLVKPPVSLSQRPELVEGVVEEKGVSHTSTEPALSKANVLSVTQNLLELKGDKMPIAIYEKMDPFNNYEIKLEKGDAIYLFSDGYADQFGGPKNKKFMYKAFKELLITNFNEPLNLQKERIEENIIKWMGKNEQVDDITVLGIKI